jgi:hypothetical protein
MLFAGALSHMLLVLDYSTGSDFFFNFMWIRGGGEGDGSEAGEWCEIVQERGSSCYNVEHILLELLAKNYTSSTAEGD